MISEFENAEPEQGFETRIQRTQQSSAIHPLTNDQEDSPKTARLVEITEGEHLRIDGKDFPWFVLGVTAKTSPDDVSTVQISIPVRELIVTAERPLAKSRTHRGGD